LHRLFEFDIEITKNRINSFGISNPQGGLLNKDGLSETNQISSSKKIELAFQKIEEHDEYVSKGGTKELLSLFYASMGEVTEWFTSYHVESIEIWISGVIKSGGITKLVVSAIWKEGMKVVLKPKQMQAQIKE
jgi:hypothetical protein